MRGREGGVEEEYEDVGDGVWGVSGVPYVIKHFRFDVA